jgi:hypothetical protein
MTRGVESKVESAAIIDHRHMDLEISLGVSLEEGIRVEIEAAVEADMAVNLFVLEL